MVKKNDFRITGMIMIDQDMTDEEMQIIHGLHDEFHTQAPAAIGKTGYQFFWVVRKDSAPSGPMSPIEGFNKLMTSSMPRHLQYDTAMRDSTSTERLLEELIGKQDRIIELLEISNLEDMFELH